MIHAPIVEQLYQTTMRKFGVKRFAAKKAVDWWLYCSPDAIPGAFLKGAFESEAFKQKLQKAIQRGNMSLKKRRKLKNASVAQR